MEKMLELLNALDAEKITRVEIIEEKGRVYVRWDVRMTPSIQDNGHTLKLFVRKRNLPAE